MFMKIKNSYIDIKQKNMPATASVDAVYELIERVANKTYAENIVLTLTDDDGFDFYEIDVHDDKIRITASLRNENFESLIEGLYPCGEGAGYAGGITSAGIDGVRIAEAIIKKYKPN